MASNETRVTQHGEIITMSDLHDICWELFAGAGVRGATKLRDALVLRDYPELPVSTIQSWIDREHWRDRLRKQNAEQFPHLMQEIAGDLMLAGMYAARRQLEANASGEVLDKEEREQIRMAIDHSGFAPVGQATGIMSVKSDAQTRGGDNVRRTLTEAQIESIRTTGHLPVLVSGVRDSTPDSGAPN